MTNAEPPGVSLRSLNLMAPDGLECPEGGMHHILEPELLVAAGDMGGTVRCQKCGGTVELRSLHAL
jgi:hypothetical protein